MPGNLIRFAEEILFIVAPYGRWRLLALFFVLVAQVVAQTLTLLAVMLFMTAFGDKTFFTANPVGMWLATLADGDDPVARLTVTGILSVVIIVLSSVVSLVTDYLRHVIAHDIGRWLRLRLITMVMHREFEFFLNTKSSVLTKKIVQDVMIFVMQILTPFLEVIMRGLLALAMIAWLAVVDVQFAVVSTVFVVVYYLIVVSAVRRKAKGVSDKVKESTRDLYSVVGQSLASVREICAFHIQRHFIDRCDAPSRELARQVPLTHLLSGAPRYLLEALIFSGVTVLLLVSAGDGETFAEVGTKLASLAIIVYRLGPTAQIIIAQIVSIATTRQAMEEVLDELRDLNQWGPVGDVGPGIAVAAMTDMGESEGRTADAFDDRMPFENQLVVRDLSFRYHGAERPALQDVSLTVAAGRHVALVGPTGSGKSTLVELLLGLLKPGAGAISIDGVDLGPRTWRAWSRQIAYVPQDIVLIDCSIAENIAFGVDPQAIDMTRVRQVAAMADAAGFIENSLANGYETLVGERGIGLSGGQKQRIGIARALYRQPRLLILDEATSALDNLTEARIVENLSQLSPAPAIVTIAHRLSTVRNVDMIYFIRDGRIAAAGDFQTLYDDFEEFRALART